MKKVIAIVVFILSVMAITHVSFAQIIKKVKTKDPTISSLRMRGKIVAIDQAKSQVVVKDDATGMEKTMLVDPKFLLTLKMGDKVKVTGRKVHKIHKNAAKK